MTGACGSQTRRDQTSLYAGRQRYLDLNVHIENEGGFDLDTEEGLSPEHQASLRATWHVNDDVSVNPSVYYVSELPASNVDDYVRLDVNIGWKINDNMKFNVIGQNLLDNKHREFGPATGLNTAEIERSIFGKMTWEF